MKLKTIVAAVAITVSSAALAEGSVKEALQDCQTGDIGFTKDFSLSQKMLNKQEVNGDILKILHARQSGEIAPNTVNIGGKGEMYTVYQKSEGKLSGFAQEAVYPSSGASPTTAIKFPCFDLSFAGTIGNWASAYVDLSASNISSGNINLPNVYVIVGNKDKSSAYGFAGKKVVEFGNFDSVNNFMPTLTRAYFMAYGAQAGFGYDGSRINTVFTIMNGNGKHLLNSKASNANQLNDFALSTTFSNELGKISYHAGIGYINATGFSRKSAPNDNGSAMVGAVNLNTGMKFKGFKLDGEVFMTIQGVRGMNSSSVYYNEYDKGTEPANGGNDTVGYQAFSFNALPVLAKFNSGANVKAWSLNSSYSIPVNGKDIVPYISYSQVAQNFDNNLYQVELGGRYNLIDSVWVGASYNHISGKNSGDDVGKFNTMMVSTAFYF